MKLYYAPGACSLTPHIVLCEIGLKCELEKVDLRTKKTERGLDYSTISEKGAVPQLVLEDGQVLTEGVVIAQYLADLKPESGLCPQYGTFDRVRVQEWLNYISSDFHKNHTPIFYNYAFGKGFDGEACSIAREKLRKIYNYIASKLEGKNYLVSDRFTIADAAAFTVLGWHSVIPFDLQHWPVLEAYTKRIAERPAVKEAMSQEGLI